MFSVFCAGLWCPCGVTLSLNPQCLCYQPILVFPATVVMEIQCLGNVSFCTLGTCALLVILPSNSIYNAHSFLEMSMFYSQRRQITSLSRRPQLAYDPAIYLAKYLTKIFSTILTKHIKLFHCYTTLVEICINERLRAENILFEFFSNR